MQEASMSLQSIAVLLPYKETPSTNSQLHRLNRLPTTPKSAGPTWTRRRLLVTNGASQGQEPSKEIRLDKQDLMAIEFGRLLGESKEKTISKVLRRKIDPSSTYIGLEKQVKAGQELINKADFAMKVERPRGASTNGSMLGSEPRLAAPPMRSNGLRVNLPKVGANADAQEFLDDSLLRKPLSSQSSKAVSPIMSSASLMTKNGKRPESQRMKAVEERSGDLDMLRRPLLDKGHDNGKLSLNSGNEMKESSSVSSEDGDSLEASKLQFQRLLDKAFHTSTDNLSSPSVRPSNVSMASTAQDGSRLVDAAADLPDLSSPPSRHRGSIGTFVLPAQGRRKATMKSSPSDTLDESLLRKPEVQASDGVSSDELHTHQYNKSPMPPNAKDEPDLDEASAIPQLAAAPSRHRGSLGTFSQPSRANIGGMQSRSQELLDNSVDKFLLRKPSGLEKSTVSMVSTAPTETSSTPLSSSKQTQSKDETLDDNFLPRPLKEADTTEIDKKSGHQIDGSKQDASEKSLQMPRVDPNYTLDNTPGIDSENLSQVSKGLKFGNGASASVPDTVLKTADSPQSHEQLAEPRTPNGLEDIREDSNGLSPLAESGGLQEVKSVKVAALKKPVRVSSSDLPKGSVPDSAQGLVQSPEVIQQASSLFAEREKTLPGNPNNSKDSATVHEVAESVDISSRLNNVIDDSNNVSSLNNVIDDSNNVSSLAPKEASSEDQPREQQAQFTPTPGTEQTKSMNMLGRRPQHVEFSTQLSKLADLQASNPKLHQAKEEEEKDWARAEALLKAKEQVEVKMIGSNSAGLFVSLGCLVGFLPSFELSSKRGLVDFGSWAQQKGYDSSQKKAVKGAIDGSHMVSPNVEEGKLSPATEGDLDDLNIKYKEEVLKLMSSFVGERTKVIVKLLDKGRRKLRVSEKEADPGCQEHLQKKANLMAELNLGEVVTCQVKSITPIGIFVEIDGVPALIHHSEVSWNTRVDPASLLSIGEVIKAKVCRLDRTLQRINLSLKQMQPDPLKRTLESVVGDVDTDSPMQASESAETNWPELGDLIRKLEQLDHISSVSRGRCLYSAAFAPTFQVLISTPQSNGYKLLARFENKIQEILVDTTLDREKMKECIRVCTFSEA